jgi:hypothetical protein
MSNLTAVSGTCVIEIVFAIVDAGRIDAVPEFN